MAKIFIVGATGYIGKKLLAAAAAIGPACGLSTTEKGESLALRLEALNAFDYRLINSGDIILLTAAISAPDICANDKDRAWSVNVTGTSAFIASVIARGAKVVFFSSDTVYGENSVEFSEDQACNPAGEYAEMKRAVETRFAHEPSFKAIRLSYVFSRDDKFTRYLIGCVEKNAEADIFHPFCRAVIHRDDVISGALALAKNWDDVPEKIINFSGPDVISRIEFAETLRDEELQTLTFTVTEPDAAFFNNRPRIIAMKSSILPRLLGRPVHSLQQAIKIEFADNGDLEQQK